MEHRADGRVAVVHGIQLELRHGKRDRFFRMFSVHADWCVPHTATCSGELGRKPAEGNMFISQHVDKEWAAVLGRRRNRDWLEVAELEFEFPYDPLPQDASWDPSLRPSGVQLSAWFDKVWRFEVSDEIEELRALGPPGPLSGGALAMGRSGAPLTDVVVLPRWREQQRALATAGRYGIRAWAPELDLALAGLPTGHDDSGSLSVYAVPGPLGAWLERNYDWCQRVQVGSPMTADVAHRVTGTVPALIDSLTFGSLDELVAAVTAASCAPDSRTLEAS